MSALIVKRDEPVVTKAIQTECKDFLEAQKIANFEIKGIFG